LLTGRVLKEPLVGSQSSSLNGENPIGDGLEETYEEKLARGDSPLNGKSPSTSNILLQMSPQSQRLHIDI